MARAVMVRQPIPARSVRRKTLLSAGGKLVAYLVLCLMALVFLAPFLWSVSSSLKTGGAIWEYPPRWIPEQPWHWENYREGLRLMKYGLRLRYTVLYAGLGTLGTLLSSSLVAYGFARLRFVGREMLFRVMLSTMMLPALVVLIPTFLIWFKLGITNNYLPLILPAYFASAFNVFLLRQFFLTLPVELEDAAKIDGCNPLQTWWRIFMPLSKPALVTVGVLAFMGAWGDFLGPAVYLSDADLYPLSLGVYFFRAGIGGQPVRWDYLLACSVAITIPPLLLFLFAQRYIIEGAVTSGLSGR